MMIISTPKKILELPRHVAEKIAAGEIVDRPVSVMKELIENAIDSGADQIVAEIRNGGKTYIRVTDNGCGIDRDDAETAFRRHATSKIASVEDLDSIMTLGFRGEALASMAAVSKVELITKTRDERAGVKLRIAGGKVEEKNWTGCPDGTTIIITDLFYNVPARYKFLKTDASESGLIIDLVSKLALAYPSIKVRLVNNGTVLFSTTGKGDIYSNILTIYSREFGEGLIPIKEQNDLFAVKAFISPIGTTKSNRRFQIYFVNGRYISSKVIDNALAEAYKEKIAEGRYPAAFIFLETDPRRLDVNIHPNKKEIRFDDEQGLTRQLSQVISAHLRTPEAIPLIRKTLVGIDSRSEDQSSRQIVVDINKLFETKRLEKSETAISQEHRETIHRVSETSSDYGEAADEITEQPFKIGNLKVTGSLFNTYITAVESDYFYLIDQHAAHERIFYEKLIHEYGSSLKHSQKLLSPYIVEATYGDKANEPSWIGPLLDIGFEIEPFGMKSYIVKSVPLFMTLQESREFVSDYLDNAAEGMAPDDSKRIDKIIMNACKSAVKAHDALDLKEMKQLVKDLSEAGQPYTCPHGRPVFLRLSRHEIEKMFKRL